LETSFGTQSAAVIEEIAPPRVEPGRPLRVRDH
jgi:hypothetical protein